MIKVIKCFKGATHVDKYNKRYKAKTTFIIKHTPFHESYYLTNGMLVSKNTCLERIK